MQASGPISEQGSVIVTYGVALLEDFLCLPLPFPADGSEPRGDVILNWVARWWRGPPGALSQRLAQFFELTRDLILPQGRSSVEIWHPGVQGSPAQGARGIFDLTGWIQDESASSCAYVYCAGEGCLEARAVLHLRWLGVPHVYLKPSRAGHAPLNFQLPSTTA